MLKDIVFILALASFLGACIRSFRIQSLSWIQYLLLIISVLFIWWAFPSETGLQLAFGLLILFSVIPALLIQASNKLVYQGQYKKAAYMTAVLGLLLPLNDSKTTVKYYKSIQLIQDGNWEQGNTLLQEVIAAQKPFSRLAEISFHNINCDYDWIIQKVTPEDIKKYPQILQYKIKALGEKGQLESLVNEGFLHKEKLSPQGILDQNQAMTALAAYCGSNILWKIFSPKALKSQTAYAKDFWEATFHYVTSGDKQAYLEALERFSQIVPSLYQKSLSYRATQAKIGYSAEPLTENGRAQLASLEAYFSNYQNFTKTERKQFPLVTVLLLFANISVYLLIATSKSPILQNHFEYGALAYPYSLMHGEWWRFFTACFVHMNWDHLLVNILVFIYFPFVEKTLGHIRFALVYLISGIGAFLLGFLLIDMFHLVDYPTIVLGASGAISGVIGCLAGISFQAWQGNGLPVARKISIAMFLAAAAQCAYDFFFLRESIWFHLLGFLIGLSLFLGMSLKQSEPITPKKIFSLVGLSWTIFLLLAFVKIPYDLDHKKPITDRLSYTGGYISEFAGEPQAASKWYLKSAEMGNVDAQAQIAYRYEEGDGVQRDSQKAVYWLKKAAEQDSGWAQVNLARSYAQGTGTAIDLPEAYYWYSIALRNPAIDQTNYKTGLPFALETIKRKLSGEEFQLVSARLKNAN